MSLLAPAWLVLCAFAVLVLVLHMQRPRTLEIPSLRLWRHLAGGTAARRAIRPPPPNVAMLLQLLALVLIAMALARPVIGAAPRYAHEVVVLDASASMRFRDVAPDRFGAALAQLDTITASASETGARLTVILAGPAPRVIAARLESPDGLGGQLSGLRAGDGETEWTKVGRLAAGVVKDGESTRLVIVSDRPDRAARALGAAVSGVAIETRRVGGGVPRNAALAATLRPLQPDGRTWRAEGTVTFSPGYRGPARVTALIEPQGGPAGGFLASGGVDVPPPAGEPARDPVRTAFALDLDLSEPSAVVLRLEDDDGPQDNAVHFVVRPTPRRLKILLLGAASDPLVRALRAAGDVELVTSDALPADVSGFDLAVINGVEVAARPATNVLWIGAAHAADSPPPAPEGAAVPEVWRDDHPLSRSVDWNAVRPRQSYRFSPLPGAATLVAGGAAPLVEARSTRSGREVRVAFDLDGAEWTGLPGFPIFLSNLLHWMAPDLGRTVDLPCAVGEVCVPDPRLAGGQMRLAAPLQGGGGGQPAALPLPDRSAGGTQDDDLAFVPERAGLYRFTRGSLTGYSAVNAPEAAAVPPDTAAPAAPAAAVDIIAAWRWLIAAALAAVALEAFVGRGPERFLHRAALSAGNPLAPRRRLLLGLRAAVLVLLAMSLAGVPLPAPDRHQNVVIIAGPEVGKEDGARLARVDAARAAAGAAVRLGAVSSGADARVVRDLGDAPAAAPAAPSPLQAAADLEAALKLAGAMLPAGEPGRVVVAFDGNETRGKAALALAPLVDRGLQVDVLPDTHLYPGEALVEDVSVPPRIYAGESFPLDTVIYSQGRSSGTLRILKDGEIIATRPFEVAGGERRVETVIPAAAAGRARYEVAIDAAGDHFAQNNRDGVAIDVAPPPQVLIIAPQAAWGEVFARALGVHGIGTRVVEPRRAPYYLKDWLAYSAVVLMNVPAIDLTTRQQELIEKAVAEHGRGLLVLGGENSFGPGGYYETPLERVSPLSSRVPREAPRVALVFVLDRSGSMQRDEGGATRLDIAKQATLSAVRLLHPDSAIAIVVFDSEAKVLLPMGRAGDAGGIATALQQLEPGGGTSIYPGLVEALRQFDGVDAAAKHIVVMSDGLTQPGDFPGIIQAITDQGISVSAVAIGDGADPAQLREIARLGRGAFHATQDFKALPGILSQEALLLSAKPVEERETAPVWVDRNAEFFAGLPDRMPALGGYVLTTRKPPADLHLVVPDEKDEPVPLLASWRYGNGRVVALATHGAGAWTRDWQRMPQYPLLWSQTLRHVISAGGAGLSTHVTRHGDVIEIETEATGPEGAPREGLSVAATLSPGDGSPARLAEISPGRYRARVTLAGTGEMTLRLTAGETAAETPLLVSYPALYRFSAASPDRLAALATATGGRILQTEDGMFTPQAWRWVRLTGWPVWTAAAFVLFIIDLITRYAPGLVRFRRPPQTAA